MKLSIILPIFNTGHLVERAIESIIGLKNIDVEILCLNDGSTDKSLEILKKLTVKYPQIRLIDKKNEGLSCTRNRGILEAKGDYIHFLDSDDWVNTEAFDQLLTYCYQNFDIIHGNFSYIYEDGTIIQNKAQLEGVFTGQDFLCQGLLQDKVSMASCINIFKREFLLKHQLFFLPNIYHEDEEFNLRVFSYANHIVSKDISFHMYLQRLGSISNDSSKEEKRFADIMIIYKNILDFLNRGPHLKEEYKKMCSTYVSFMILLSYAKQNNEENIKETEKKIRQLKLYQTIHSEILIYKASSLALRIVPIIYIRLLRIYFRARSKKL